MAQAANELTTTTATNLATTRHNMVNTRNLQYNVRRGKQRRAKWRSIVTSSGG